jgi:hypothetical protein
MVVGTKKMIMYTACNNVYFDLYFYLWAMCANKFYPGLKKYVAIGDAAAKQIEYCSALGCTPIPFNIRKQRDDESWLDYRQIFFLLRWQHLPWQKEDRILETQINCLAIKTQNFENITVPHLRISRIKRGLLGGLSAAVFAPEAAKLVSDKALSWNEYPPQGDHPINKWTEDNIKYECVLSEQQFKCLTNSVESQTCWITSGSTSSNFTHEAKIEILNYYLKKVGIEC